MESATKTADKNPTSTLSERLGEVKAVAVFPVEVEDPHIPKGETPVKAYVMIKRVKEQGIENRSKKTLMRMKISSLRDVPNILVCCRRLALLQSIGQ